MHLSGETFLKKGYPPYPLPKTLILKQLSPAQQGIVVLNTEVLGKEFEENPFSKGFSSIIRTKFPWK